MSSESVSVDLVVSASVDLVVSASVDSVSVDLWILVSFPSAQSKGAISFFSSPRLRLNSARAVSSVRRTRSELLLESNGQTVSTRCQSIKPSSSRKNISTRFQSACLPSSPGSAPIVCFSFRGNSRDCFNCTKRASSDSRASRFANRATALVEVVAALDTAVTSAS